jgi:two-component system chemotaxis response regulator CheB
VRAGRNVRQRTEIDTPHGSADIGARAPRHPRGPRPPMPTLVPPDAAPAGPPVAPRPRLVVAIGASLGGVAALREVLGALPAGFPGAVLVVLHLEDRLPSLLADVLRPALALDVHDARAGERAAEGTVYLAPPGAHLRVEADGTLSLSSGPPVHNVRPSADVLFASAAASFGAAVVAVVLTGRNRDGADGAVRVRAGGGRVIAQDPAGAAAAGMPESAIRAGAVDLVLPLEAIAPALLKFAEGLA